MSEARNAFIEQELTALRKEVQHQGIRLNLAEAWLGLYQLGYDALRSWGVDFKKLKEFGDGYPGFKSKTKDSVDKLPASLAQTVYINWIRRIENAIEAAVRRKQFRVHENPPSDEIH